VHESALTLFSGPSFTNHILVIVKALIVSREGNDENDVRHVLEAVYDLLLFDPAIASIDHHEVILFQMEHGLGDYASACARV
jgi:hypothetical protein